MEKFEVSLADLAAGLDMTRPAVRRLLDGKRSVDAELALRLSRALSRSPESWLAMQADHDLYQCRRKVDLRRVRRIRLTD